MTMIYGLSKEDNLVMIIENIIFDNGYLDRATIENKVELLESLIVAREEVNPLNKTRIKRAINILKRDIVESMTEGLRGEN